MYVPRHTSVSVSASISASVSVSVSASISASVSASLCTCNRVPGVYREDKLCRQICIASKLCRTIWSIHGAKQKKQGKSKRWTFSTYRCVPKIGFLEFSWGQTEKTREIKSGGRNRPIVVYLKSGFFGVMACPEPAVPGNPFEIPLEPYSYRC